MLLFLLVIQLATSFTSYHRRHRRAQFFAPPPSLPPRTVSTSTTSLGASASVGGGVGMPTPPPRSVLVVPSTSAGESELLILENFSQIQYGEKKKFGVIGTSDLSNNHRQMVELLAYALVLNGNHVFTSAGGMNSTNIAVIKGALRACNPDLLTVILPQSLFRQPPEIHPLLLRVANLVQQPQYDDADIREAAYMCNEVLISNVDKMLVFAYHDSTTILDAIDNVAGDIETIKFYLD